MEDILCDISAFQYHRTPTHVLNILPPIQTAQEDPRRKTLLRHPLFEAEKHNLVHLLARDRRKRRHSPHVQTHLASAELPFGSVTDTSLNVKVTSPLYTLYQLSFHLDPIHLLMAMYEFCGTFSIYKASRSVSELIKAVPGISLDLASTWTCVKDKEGEFSDLWRRPPLIEIDELRHFARSLSGMRGCLRFQRAAESVTGIVASPFEAQLSILLSLPRKQGGENLNCFVNNERITLSDKAARLAGRRTCYADLLFKDTGHKRPLIVECQGRIIHNNPMSLMSDSDRIVALQQMGYNVLPLTYAQIANAKNFDTVRRHIFKELGRKYKTKTDVHQQAEIDLRRNLFIDWGTLAH